MPLRSRPDDRQAQPRPWRSVAAAPEALERLLGLARARPLVGDADQGAVSVPLDRDRDSTSRRPVAACILDEVRDRALERGVVAGDAHQLRSGLDAVCLAAAR